VFGWWLVLSGMLAKDTLAAVMAFMFMERGEGRNRIDYPVRWLAAQFLASYCAMMPSSCTMLAQGELHNSSVNAPGMVIWWDCMLRSAM
jgi:hypothetical protein